MDKSFSVLNLIQLVNHHNASDGHIKELDSLTQTEENFTVQTKEKQGLQPAELSPLMLTIVYAACFSGDQH